MPLEFTEIVGKMDEVSWSALIKCVTGSLSLLFLPAEFRGTHTHIFLEFLVRIIFILIDGLFCDLIDFQLVFKKFSTKVLNLCRL